MGAGRRVFQSAGQISSHIIPGAYSRIDSVRNSSGLLSANNGVIMGRAYGLKPATLYTFSNVTEAMNAIIGGELKEAIRLAFDPGNDLVPQRIHVMAVNTATQSVGTLKNAGSDTLITLTSKGYGLYTNQIKRTLENGTVSGKKLTIVYKDATEIFDDIIRNSFVIQYASGACTMTITNTPSTKTLVTSAGGLNITLSDYTTMEALVAYINTQTGFTASIVSGQEDADPTELDACTTVDINGSAYTAQSTMFAIIDTINALSNLVTAADGRGAAVGAAIPTNSAATYFTGGTNGAYTATEWTSALTAMEAENAQFIATPDSSSSVHAAIKTHCVAMSSVSNRKERSFFVGGAWGESESTAKTNATTLNSKYGVYVYVGGTARNVNGDVTEYAASYVACMLMGMRVAMATNMPLTSKTLNLISLEKKLSNTSIEACLEKGVCPLAYNANGIASIVRGLTTYQADDLKFNEESMMNEQNYISLDLRNYLQTLFIGNPGIKTSLGAIQGAVISRLNIYVENGLFTQDSQGRTYWNVIVTQSGDTFRVDYDANLTAPINFIFATQHFSEAV